MTSKKIPGHVERVGLFGGSFDPIHLGHLILAESAMEELQLDRIIFIPAGVSPFKKDRPPGASSEQRLSMVREAIKEESRFSVDERELRRAGPSYTIDTVRSLLGDYPGVRFIYLIGADNLADLHKWHEIEELKNLVDFALLDRGDAISDAETEFPVVRRRIDLSSTEIRERVAKGLSIRFMVPSSVYDTVMTSHLYLTSSHGNV
jgi:nicotinate-nucleotide adenylyltransferase